MPNIAYLAIMIARIVIMMCAIMRLTIDFLEDMKDFSYYLKTTTCPCKPKKKLGFYPAKHTRRKEGPFAHKNNTNLTPFSDQHTCHEGLQPLWR